MIDKFVKKVTIYNDIPKTSVEPRHWDRRVIDKCLVYSGTVEGTNETIQTITNAQNVITRDVEHYKSPLEYALIPVDEREQYYTVQPDDFIVFDEVFDVVTTAVEWGELQKKYKNNGMSVTTVNPYIFGMKTDNIAISNA